MSKDCPQYRVVYTGANGVEHTCKDGPWDYHQAAIGHRNLFFAAHPDVLRCWVTKERVLNGRVLERT